MKGTSGALSIQEQLDKKAKRKTMISTFLPFTGLVFISVFFIFATNGNILSSSNLSNLLSQCYSVSLVAVGASFVYAHGGMDFSIGASSGLAQLVAALLLTRSGLPVWVAIVACTLTGVVCATIVGGTSVVLGVPVFVVSMCMRAICAGLLTVGVSRSNVSIDYLQYRGFNNEALKLGVLVVIIAIGYFLFEYTALGKSEKAIGGNIMTAFQAGVKVGKSTILAYSLLGLCVGIAAFFQLTRAGTVGSSSGNGLEFDIMIAVVLGGFPMTGGSAAKLRSAIIGALTITILSNGLILWGLDFFLVNGAKGILFLIIVGISYDRSNQNQVALM